MKEGIINIVIAEPSSIVYEGLSGILNRRGHQQMNILRADDLNALAQLQQRTNVDLVMINPSLIQNQTKLFNNIKREFPSVQWVGIVYSFYDHQLTSMLDTLIPISDTPERIVNSVQKLIDHQSMQTDHHQQQTENLSEREIEVLKLLVAGNSNKEIADKLFISTHTVVTHRKNISQKTGIKSVSGLTIYAVVNNIITLENFSE